MISTEFKIYEDTLKRIVIDFVKQKFQIALTDKEVLFNCPDVIVTIKKEIKEIAPQVPYEPKHL